jgi:hypothetical protein
MLDDQIKILKVHEVNKTDMVERFLLEMLLTHEWSNEFQNVLIKDNQERWSNHISDYLFDIGLLQYADSNDLKYAVSAKGRKYLEQIR